ncbi:hypothetical protein ACFQ9Y_16920 [Peribacillus simplex]|uniref:hypothetical protein n=1 Tax=Peribacillus simplex TaxID=1478 RepID=UPI003671124F
MSDKKLIVIIIGMCLVWPIYTALNRQQPMEAAGMTAEERAENDNTVLMEELKSQDIVKSVEVKYEYESISVYLDIPRTEQYANQTADDIEDAVNEALEERRGDLTIEEDFTVYVYDENERPIR